MAMALISETFDDGSNGGDPNKKPEELHKNPQEEEEEEEEENQNENPHEDDQEEEEIENLPPIPRHIPEELIEIILALVRRCHYPRLSLISRAFRHVISSQELFVRRSRLGLTEPVLYTWISSPPFDHPSWFILYRSNASLRLSRIPSLPYKLQGSTAVTIGHNMYLMGGCIGLNQPVNAVIVIDCRFHTYRELPSMRRDRCYAAAGVIDGNIYVVGGCKKRYDDWIEVLDVEKEIWKTVPGLHSSVDKSSGVFAVHVVMDNKIYVLDGQFCLAYDPRRRKWNNWGSVSQLRRFWNGSSGVVDDMLYTIDPRLILGSPIVVYDPRDMVWRPVKGVDPWSSFIFIESAKYIMANFGGNLVVLGYYRSLHSCHVWCAEVALEKREDGDIWGKVESISLVHSFRKSPFFEVSRTVTV